jgi:hypothetical protein
VTRGTGLALMPFVAQQLITAWGVAQCLDAPGVVHHGYRNYPAVLLMARRPEDMHLEPDHPLPSASLRP